MAAPMQCLTFKRLNISILSNLLKNVRIYRSLSATSQTSDTASKENDDYDELERQEVERRIAKLRDVSGLNKFEKARMNGVMPSINSNRKYLKSRSFYRKMYAAYGSTSGVKPGIMWPSKGELQDLQEIERDWTPSFQDMVKKLQQEKTSHMEEERLRIEDVQKNMEKMPDLIAEYKKKQLKAAEVETSKSEKIEKIQEEFRQKFGFSVDPDSPKFKMFRSTRIAEDMEKKKKEKKVTKKAAAEKMLQDMLETGSGAKY
ncbi:G45IP-like protein [Mya arenaria]|uniref:Large ribosomal subunit protein mL64 n=1 Tax=Mya arenaria TaxID=6604 RepID=A0ABY7FQC9_MYAAR|nr:growth arrest and DNA damage-inducible proteins-interacting protein 1-like [Mya arenaria]WAR22928.1 G45IP-like protein [Mya arenaria]